MSTRFRFEIRPRALQRTFDSDSLLLRCAVCGAHVEHCSHNCNRYTGRARSRPMVARTALASKFGKFVLVSWITVWTSASAIASQWTRGIDPVTGWKADGLEAGKLNAPGVIYEVGNSTTTVVSANPQALSSEAPSARLVAWGRVVRPGGTEIAPGSDVPNTTQIDVGVLKNAGPDALTVTWFNASGSQTRTLAPGMAILIGAPRYVMQTHVAGCSCTCTKEGQPSTTITFACPPAIPNLDSCPCTQWDNVQCEIGGTPQNPVWGKTSDCARALPKKHDVPPAIPEP